MATPNPIQFVQQTRAEVGKITWPTRREVTLTTVMVFLLAIIAAAFFFFVDFLIRTGLTTVLESF
ncbi:protein translocase subunit SecE [Jannaschia pagri]|uniref:Protein translocase subunit SecE n=1 Tax=Jannaschia pagri TaxID=2829797 RepID=A0ABQ4NH99_9RHOB|nr:MULTISPECIES: preprotein translocase subunit SecE [unclassified Jannaschia]GIT90248.1 protein translocase subunit SecE [Jannaschia sp. AI_61]GIT93646.1 protein translocase subunit SecE [Jannaschia sp. AI_62]